jgi:hypothetical protein
LGSGVDGLFQKPDTARRVSVGFETQEGMPNNEVDNVLWSGADKCGIEIVAVVSCERQRDASEDDCGCWCQTGLARDDSSEQRGNEFGPARKAYLLDAISRRDRKCGTTLRSLLQEDADDSTAGAASLRLGHSGQEMDDKFESLSSSRRILLTCTLEEFPPSHILSILLRRSGISKTLFVHFDKELSRQIFETHGEQYRRRLCGFFELVPRRILETWLVRQPSCSSGSVTLMPISG